MTAAEQMQTPAESSLRVLVLDEEVPYPLDSGKRIRTWHLLTTLARRHQITFLTYGEAGSEGARALASAGIAYVAVQPRRMETGPWLYARLVGHLLSRKPFSVSKHARRRFHKMVQDQLALQRFDLIQCEWTPYAQFAPRSNQNGARPPVLLATHNIEADILARRGEVSGSRLGRSFFRVQARRMEDFERSVFARADHVTTVSELDRERAVAWGARSTSVVANGVDTEHIRPSPEEPWGKELLFLGSLDWFANIDAVQYFAGEILHLIRRRDPEIRFTVVGRRPASGLRDLLQATEGATLVGEVADVGPYLRRAAAIVVPLRIGGGTRIKILEAMSAGKIVVSTSVGAEGLEVENGGHLLLADTPQSFAQASLDAMDSSRYRNIPEAARRLVVERYSWRIQAENLEQCWLALAGKNAPSKA